jgi:homoserine O-acetyltransferase
MHSVCKNVLTIIAVGSLILGNISSSAEAGAPAPAPGASGTGKPKVQVAHIGSFSFQNGAVVPNFRISYVTRGKLNKDKSNVVLVMHHFFGDRFSTDFLIGPGNAFDTEKYFVVSTDFLGNSREDKDITTGPTNSGLRMLFPDYTMYDSTHLEVKLLKEQLGIERILAASGVSYGAMKSFQIGASFPNFVSSIIPIVGNHKTDARTRIVLGDMKRAISMHPGWLGGNYVTNPGLAPQFAMRLTLPWLYSQSFFRKALNGPEGREQFDKTWEKWFGAARADARDFFYSIDTWRNFDIGKAPGFDGDTDAALRGIKAKTLIVAARDDMLFDRESLMHATKLIPDAEHLEIDTMFGHMICCGFGGSAVGEMKTAISTFLAARLKEVSQEK